TNENQSLTLILSLFQKGEANRAWQTLNRYLSPRGDKMRGHVPRKPARRSEMRTFSNITFLFALFCFAGGHNSFAIGGVDTAPAPAAPHATSFTHPKEMKLSNGLRVIVAERRSLPLLAVELIIRSGSE